MVATSNAYDELRGGALLMSGCKRHCRTLVVKYIRTDVIQVAWAKRAKCHIS